MYIKCIYIYICNMYIHIYIYIYLQLCLDRIGVFFVVPEMQSCNHEANQNAGVFRMVPAVMFEDV